MMTAIVTLIAQTMDGCMILNKLGQEESEMLSGSGGNVNCQNVSIFSKVFQLHPKFSPVSPKTAWAVCSKITQNMPLS